MQNVQNNVPVVTWVERGYLSRQDARRQMREKNKQYRHTVVGIPLGPGRARKRAEGRRKRLAAKHAASVAAVRAPKNAIEQSVRGLVSRPRGV